MKMSFNGQTIFVTLADNSATRDLVSRLKAGALTIEFSDYGGSEKIGYPSPALDVSNANGCDPVVGNLTIYTPWGNLAAFYKDTAGYSDSLVLIGTIEGNGIEILAAQSGTFSVTIEIAL
ncbi:MAG: cyclophilin-like fold protein [Christensenellaceae bacterium]